MVVAYLPKMMTSQEFKSKWNYFELLDYHVIEARQKKPNIRVQLGFKIN